MNNGPAMLFWLWQIASTATTAFLIWEDWPHFNWWNWLFLIPINVFLGEIWPAYWLILRPIFGS